MTFLCKDCGNEFDVNDNECRGYHNWKCPKCSHIAVKKDSSGLGIIWKCDTGTYKKENSACASCPNAS